MDGSAITIRPVETGIVAVSIDRPPVNALALRDWEALQTAFVQLDGDSTVRVVILSGSPTTFCAGADIAHLTESAVAPDGTTALRMVGDVARAIRRLRAPVIAAIRGPAHGGGLELALACDIRIADHTASFAAAGVNMGLIASVSSLIRTVGAGRARSMLLTGRRIDAATALDWGLITEVVDGQVGDVFAEALATSAIIASKPPLAIEATKRAATDFHQLAHGEHDALVDQLFTELAGSADHREALAAFLEKRSGTYGRS